MKSEYHGIYAALVTPYTSEGKVDYRELQKLVDYLICQGLEGFYVNGSTAEAFLLSEEERNSTIRAVVEVLLKMQKSVEQMLFLQLVHFIISLVKQRLCSIIRIL